MRLAKTCMVGGAVAVLVSMSGVAVTARQAVPDLQSAWLAMGGELKEIGTTPTPTRQDPRYRYVPNNTSEQPTYRIGDVGNPNFKPWVAAAMDKIRATQSIQAHLASSRG